jgi:polyphosphate kinase
MHRNLDRRVESLVRVDKAAHKKVLQEILDISMDPKTSSWHQQDMNWTRVNENNLSEELTDIQSKFIKRNRGGRN